MEKLIADALDDAGVRYTEEGHEDQRLDFHLPDHGVYIEVKQFHSDRIGAQMATHPNVVVAQGRPAVEFLASLIRARAIASGEEADAI